MTRHTILVVDDEEELRENLQDLLEFKGYNVIAVESGEAALARLDKEEVDLVLLDIQLPGIDGLEVLKRIKAMNSQIPVAMVSASSIQQVLEKAHSLGADKIVIKPYSLEQMLSAVQELLTKSSQE